MGSTSQPLSENLSSIVYCCNCRGQRELSSPPAPLDLGLYLVGHRLSLGEHLHRLHSLSQRLEGRHHIVPGHKRPAGNPGGSPLSIIGRPSTVRGCPPRLLEGDCVETMACL